MKMLHTISRNSIRFVLVAASYAAAQQSMPVAPISLTSAQIGELIRQAAGKDIENDKKQRNYTYIQRQEERKLNGKGELQSTESTTSDVMILYGEQVRRVIAKNDKPLSEKDAAKEEEKIQKFIEKHKDESEGDRARRVQKEEKEREDGRKFVREVTDAYNFHLDSIADFSGRQTYVIDAEPRPGFEPHSKDAKILPKFRFRVWIDMAEAQWVKLDAECLDTVLVGWFLARIHQGSRLLIEQTRVNDDVWLPQHVGVKLDARIALLKSLNAELDVRYRDYKKFRTDIKIIPANESQMPH